MKRIPNLVSCLLIVPGLMYGSHVLASSASDNEWESQRQQLDAACEAARQNRLNEDLPGFIDECVEKKQKESREACERFYSDYGNQSGSNAPLHYDLPECVRAFEHSRS